MRILGQPSGGFQPPITPEQDQPKTKRAYPIKVREPGPALPFFGSGYVGSLKQADSHPIYGSPTPRRPLQRMDPVKDVRRELDGGS